MAKKKTTRKPYKKTRKPAGPKKRATKSTRESAAGKQASGSKTAPKRARTKKTEIVAMDANAGTLIPNNKRNSLVAWFNLYMGIEAGEPDSNTFKAKQGDLSRFVNYFKHVSGSDHPDQWTRSISQSFMKHLLRTKSERTGKKLAPTTVNRALATLRNTARWIHRQRPFLAG